MKIENIKTSELIPYEYNTKIHDKKQIENIAESIKKFGFVQPVVIDDENVIVIGHGRTEARKIIGMESVPCVRVSDLTDDEIRALRIADNKTNESPWDFENLSLELGEIDLSAFKFDFVLPVDVDENAESEIVESEEIDFDEVEEKSKSKRHICPCCGFEFEE